MEFLIGVLTGLKLKGTEVLKRTRQPFFLSFRDFIRFSPSRLKRKKSVGIP